MTFQVLTPDPVTDFQRITKFQHLLKTAKGMKMIFVNQGWRPVTLLAKARNKVLIEYVMPSGSSSMLVLPEEVWDSAEAGETQLSRSSRPPSGKPQGYGNIPFYWVKAIVEAGMEYELTFEPQQAGYVECRAYYQIFRDQVKRAKEELGAGLDRTERLTLQLVCGNACLTVDAPDEYAQTLIDLGLIRDESDNPNLHELVATKLGIDIFATLPVEAI